MRTDVTHADIARALNIARSTVTMALKGNLRVAEATRERVKQKAKELGYVPNPSLSALAAFRHKSGASQAHSSIAIIRNELSVDQKIKTRNRIYKALVERADALGYSATTFRSDFSTDSLQMILRQCHARGIRGIILFSYLPLENAALQQVDWSNFAVLSLVGSVSNETFPNMDFSVYYDTVDVIRRVAEAGYKRPGLILNQQTADLNFNLSKHAFHEACRRQKLPIRSPIFRYTKSGDPVEILAWAKAEQIDIAIGTQLAFVNEVTTYIDAGKALPFDFVCMDLNPEHIGKIAGVYGDRSELGNAAINHVHSLIQTWQLGLPQHNYSILVRKQWKNGISASKI